MDAKEFAEFEEILSVLGNDMERDDTVVTGPSANFVRDQAERYKKYRADVRLSEKQWAWLRDLHKRVTGRADDTGGLEPVDEHWRDKLK